jgi:hypothetical protein
MPNSRKIARSCVSGAPARRLPAQRNELQHCEFRRTRDDADRIRPAQGKVLEMRYLGDLKCDEIAAALGHFAPVRESGLALGKGHGSPRNDARWVPCCRGIRQPRTLKTQTETIMRKIRSKPSPYNQSCTRPVHPWSKRSADIRATPDELFKTLGLEILKQPNVVLESLLGEG